MDNNTSKKIQIKGWSKRAYSEIRHKIKVFDEDGIVRHRAMKKKKKVKCRSNAHEYEIERRPLGMRGKYWEFYTCKKCGKFKMKLETKEPRS